jgi:hypothetical protein
MREARKQYFAVNKFGDNGGYDDAWVDFKLGAIPFPFPNIKGRVRAVKFHDLHHILTGYDTDLIGEFEISAWEIAAGCKDFYAAWALNLGGLFSGLLWKPRRIVKAFARGLRSQSLYGKPLEELLDMKVGEARSRFISEDSADSGLSGKGCVLLALSALAGFVVGLLLLCLTLPLLPLGLVSNFLRKREARQQMSPVSSS